MSLRSYIRLQNQTISIEEVQKMIDDYRQSVQKTGKQLDYSYEEKAFPYSIFTPENQGSGECLYLSSKDPDYHLIRIGIGEEPIPGMKGDLSPYIEISLERNSTFADKGKANELAKYMAKKKQGDLQLFNGRIMHFHK
ncbi:hypothetical protein AC622_13595 [Bacillus sp. FJAT-27916]|uniref:DUF1885 family protein n=1 Tax=Bacillaceae TaxID=186817 RepID=UPI000670FC33|nr:DUF1885 family protein [Bacillus sp. FJAT-27916]KMY45132.1 hypothetical protein AC622_13595 [Bacillus sp. FJAT-27916]